MMRQAAAGGNVSDVSREVSPPAPQPKEETNDRKRLVEQLQITYDRMGPYLVSRGFFLEAQSSKEAYLLDPAPLSGRALEEVLHGDLLAIDELLTKMKRSKRETGVAFLIAGIM